MLMMSGGRNTLLGGLGNVTGDNCGGCCDPSSDIYDAQLCSDTGGAGADAPGSGGTPGTACMNGNNPGFWDAAGQYCVSGGTPAPGGGIDWGQIFNTGSAALQALAKTYCAASGKCVNGIPPTGWNPYATPPWYTTTGGIVAIALGVLGVGYLAYSHLSK